MTGTNQTPRKASTGRGGYRPNAGRPKGSLTQKTREIAEKCAQEGITPLEYMLRILRNEQPEHEDPRIQAQRELLRFEAAKAAAPYMHAKLAAIDVHATGGLSVTISQAENDL